MMDLAKWTCEVRLSLAVILRKRECLRDRARSNSPLNMQTIRERNFLRKNLWLWTDVLYGTFSALHTKCGQSYCSRQLQHCFYCVLRSNVTTDLTEISFLAVMPNSTDLVFSLSSSTNISLLSFSAEKAEYRREEGCLSRRLMYRESNNQLSCTDAETKTYPIPCNALQMRSSTTSRNCVGASYTKPKVSKPPRRSSIDFVPSHLSNERSMAADYCWRL